MLPFVRDNDLMVDNVNKVNKNYLPPVNQSLPSL